MRNIDDIGKVQKFFLTLVFFGVGLMYSLINLTLLYGMHSPYNMGVMNLIVFTILGFLFLRSIVYGEFGRMDASVYALLLYSIAVLIVTALYNQADQGAIKYDGGLGAVSNFYFFVAYAMIPTLMYFAPRARFMFVVRNSWLVYVPALITVLIIIFFIGDLELYAYAGQDYFGISRSTTKIPIGILFVISLCWIVLSDRIIKVAFGVVGFLVAVYAMRGSASQSLIVSSMFSFLILTLISFKSRFSLVRALAIIVVGVLGFGYFSIKSVALERLSNIFAIGDYYSFGGNYDVSRLDLMKQGFDLFLSSPVFGGNAYLPSGTYTHFYLIDILMATGLVGAALCVIVYIGVFNGVLYALKKLKTDHLWIIPFALFYMTQALFHGSLISVVSVPTGIFLALNLMRKNNIALYPCEDMRR